MRAKAYKGHVFYSMVVTSSLDIVESHIHAAGLDAFACLAIHATLCNGSTAGDAVTIETP